LEGGPLESRVLRGRGLRKIAGSGAIFFWFVREIRNRGEVRDIIVMGLVCRKIYFLEWRGLGGQSGAERRELGAAACEVRA